MKIKAKLEPGKVAVVTGGSSGIGKLLLHLAARMDVGWWHSGGILASARGRLNEN
jgi:hypothetical protein